MVTKTHTNSSCAGTVLVVEGQTGKVGLSLHQAAILRREGHFTAKDFDAWLRDNGASFDLPSRRVRVTLEVLP